MKTLSILVVIFHCLHCCPAFAQLTAGSDSKNSQQQEPDASGAPSFFEGAPEAKGVAEIEPEPAPAEPDEIEPEPTLTTVTTSSGLAPIPNAADVAEARKSLDTIYENQIKKIEKEKGTDRFQELQTLSQEIAGLLKQDGNEPASEYAIYELAIDLSKQSCYAKEAFRIVGDFENKFPVDGMAIRLELIEYWDAELPKIVRTQESRRLVFRDLARLTKDLAEKATEEKKWGFAVGFSEKLERFYKFAGKVDSAKKLKKGIPALKVKLKSELSTNQLIEELKQNPDQPEKNLTVGCHFCFVMNDLEMALPFLESSGKQELYDCVAKSLKAEQRISSEKLGDLWWKVAEDKELKRYRTMIRATAADHYIEAKFGASGLTRAKLEQRIRAVYPLPVIKIISAQFGWPRHKGKWADVTEILRNILRKDPPAFVNNSGGLGVKDPVPYYAKTTKITYTIDGVQKVAKIRASSKKQNLRELLP